MKTMKSACFVAIAVSALILGLAGCEFSDDEIIDDQGEVVEFDELDTEDEYSSQSTAKDPTEEEHKVWGCYSSYGWCRVGCNAQCGSSYCDSPSVCQQEVINPYYFCFDPNCGGPGGPGGPW